MIKERLALFLSKEGLSSSQFAEVLGIQRSNISHILSGRNKPSYDFFVKISEKFPSVNLEWFFTGKGQLYKYLSPEQKSREKDNAMVKYAETSSAQNEMDTNVNKPERIMLLYPDNTFTTYTSKKINS